MTGSGTAGLAVAHYGSNNMISFRYRLKNIPMKIAEAQFTRRRRDVPGGVVHRDRIGGRSPGGARGGRVARPDGGGAVVACRPSRRTTPTFRASRSTRSGAARRSSGWYRHAFDQFGIPFDLIYKERVAKGNLKNDYDVILMAAQNINRAAVLAPPAAQAAALSEN